METLAQLNRDSHAARQIGRDDGSVDYLGREGRRAGQVLKLLRSLDDVRDGGEISELPHALQTASRAERAGADAEVVLAALLHDIGKVFGDAGRRSVGRGAVSARPRG